MPLPESLSEDLTQFALDRVHAGLIEVRRVALTPEQIVRFGIESQPDAVKPSDSRSAAFIRRGLGPAAQLEAIRPDRLTDLVREAAEFSRRFDEKYRSTLRDLSKR